MKRSILFTAILCGLSLTALCQPQISASWIPEPGDSWNQTITLDSFDAPSLAGADVTWDLSFVTLSENEVRFEFVDPDDTPFRDSFPESNIAAIFSFMGFSVIGYYESDGSSFRYWGQGSDFGNVVFTQECFTHSSIFQRVAAHAQPLHITCYLLSA